MISGVLKISKKDAPMLEREIREEAAFYTDERVTVALLFTRRELEVFLEKRELADIICVDVSMEEGIPYAEMLRKYYPKAAIILIAEVEMSPVSYMKPTILAASLLLSPLTRDNVQRAVKEVFRQFIEKEEDEEVFIIDTREEKQRIPLSGILYFEAREKKIYACTGSREYGFYDTMDQLAERMQEGFIRCHRSYLANRNRIERVMLSRNCILLEQGIELPLSRSYKSLLKQFDPKRRRENEFG